MRSVRHETWKRPHAIAYLENTRVADHVWVLCYQGSTLIPVARVFGRIEHTLEGRVQP